MAGIEQGVGQMVFWPKLEQRVLWPELDVGAVEDNIDNPNKKLSESAIQDKHPDNLAFWPSRFKGGDFTLRGPGYWIQNSPLITSAEKEGLLVDTFLPVEGQLNHTFGDPETGEDYIYQHLPFSDLSGWVYEDEALARTENALDVQRLGSIRSLSMVSFGIIDNHRANSSRNGVGTVIAEVSQTRLNHVDLVARTIEAIMRNNDFPEEEIEIGVAGGILHDRETPAGGDATKSVDYYMLDEEKFWEENLPEDGWEYLRSIGTTEEEMNAIINNDGLLGEILDIADKIGYLMIDMWQTGETPPNPNFGNIYKDVVADRVSGQVYFSDPQRLRQLLGLRVHFFRDIYINPFNQSIDFVFAKLLEPFYSRTPQSGKLTPQDLRQMTDYSLIAFLAEKYGTFPLHLLGKKLFWFPEFIRFDNEEEAKDTAARLSTSPDLKVLGIKECLGFNPATHLKTRDPETGKIMQFREFDPETARYLEEQAEGTRGHFVIYVKRDDQDIARFLPDYKAA